jgi:hypothetical protein
MTSALIRFSKAERPNRAMRASVAADVAASRRAGNLLHRLDLDAGKPGALELATDRPGIVISEGRSFVEARRVVGEERADGATYDVRDFVALEAIPDIVHESAAWAEHPGRLPVCRCPVGKEHDTELTDDGVGRSALHGQLLSVGLSPGDRRVGRALFRDGQHARVQIRRLDADGRGQGAPEHLRQGSRTGGELDHLPLSQLADARSEILGVRLEQQRNQVLVVNRRNRSCELRVDGCHALRLSLRKNLYTSRADPGQPGIRSLCGFRFRLDIDSVGRAAPLSRNVRQPDHALDD